MISVDTNILVYAHRAESPFYEKAAEAIGGLAGGAHEWGVPWPCIHEFLSVVTNAKIFRTPTPLALALEQVSLWKESPKLRILAEPKHYWEIFENLIHEAKMSGPKIHDARIAAICLAHDVEALWTIDRDFQRFPEIKVVNPLV